MLIQPRMCRGHLPLTVRWQPVLPCLPSCILHSQIRGWSTPGDTEVGLKDAVAPEIERLTVSSPAPNERHPTLGGWPNFCKKSLKSIKSPFPAPRADLKLFLCVVLSPHINPTAVTHQHGAWTGATLPCCCFPNICWHYCTALLWSFPVP